MKFVSPKALEGIINAGADAGKKGIVDTVKHLDAISRDRTDFNRRVGELLGDLTAESDYPGRDGDNAMWMRQAIEGAIED